MKACVDIGNTQIKAALFLQKELIKTEKLSSIYSAIQWIKTNQATCGIISSVRNLSTEELTDIQAIENIFVLDFQTPLPFENRYASPETLGSDRLAAVAGAQVLFGDENILVVDAGTCLTIEILQNGKYLGGAIAPGISMRMRAMNEFTEKLPMAEIPEYLPQYGNDTRTCLQCGAVWGAVFEIESWYKKLGSARLVMTGGDAPAIYPKLFENQPAEHKKCHRVPDLVLIGLNAILEHVTNN